MDKIIVNNNTYVSNEYLEFSSQLGGEVSRANILFLLKDKKLSISNYKNPKDTDIILSSEGNQKKFYIKDSLFSFYKEKMVFDPILNLDSILEIEKKWKKEVIKKVANSLNSSLKDIDIDKIEVKGINSNSVDINKNDVHRQIKKKKLRI